MPWKPRWIYWFIIFNAINTSIVYFKLIDGDEITLSIPEKELNTLMKELNRRLPHATFGYTKDREQWFMAEPALLLRDDD